MGWEVDDVTAYRTVRAAPPAAPVREAIKGGQFDAVVFTSSSTVRNLVGIAGKPHPRPSIACIGPATAKTAEEHGLRVDVLAPEASADALVDALADYGLGLAARRRRGRRGRRCARAPRKAVGAAPGQVTDAMALPEPQRPRRLRQTPGDPAAGGRRPGCTRPSWCCRCSSARAPPSRCRSRRCPASSSTPLDSLVRGRHGGGRGRARRPDAVRRAARPRTRWAPARTTPTASSTSRCGPCADAVGDDLVVMADLCLDEFTDHGHCGVLDDARRRGQRRDPGAVRRDGASRRPRAGAHVLGLSGMMDGQVGLRPRGARRRGLHRTR